MQSFTTPTYGADASGLICGYRFEAGKAGEPIGADEAMTWLSQSEPEADFAWLHFNLSHASTGKWLQRHFPEADIFLETLRDGSRSTRVEFDGGNLVAVVNDVRYDFSFDPADIATLWLMVSPRLLVTVRLQPLRSIDRLRESVNKGASIRSTVEMLVHLMHDQGDVLVDIVRTTTARIDQIEDSLLSGRLASRRARLGALRRVLVRLQRLLAPEPAALFRLLQKPPIWIAQEDLQDLLQATEEFNVVLTDIAALQERIKLLQEEVASRVAEENNRTLFVLTMVTVLALPINIIAGLLGMNVGGIPLADNSFGFWIVVAIVAAFTVVAALVVARNRPE